MKKKLILKKKPKVTLRKKSPAKNSPKTKGSRYA